LLTAKQQLVGTLGTGNGLIVTAAQTDSYFDGKGRKVTVILVWEFLRQ
jgi:hypothetical protein